MFESGITAQELVNGVMTEVDAAPDIPADTYYIWIDETEQLLYSEIIRELVYREVSSAQADILSAIAEVNADKPRFEDIYAVYADDKQLMKVTAVGGETFPDTYWKLENKLCYSAEPIPEKIKVFYFIRPALKIKNAQQTIKLPPEWVCIVRAKLRGEAYKLVNEDNMAAKWLNDYNVLMEQFKQYILNRSPEFGV